MRIDRLELTNFRCFEHLEFDLNPHFTLFIGDNGSGKTAIIDALAIAASIWLAQVPNPDVQLSARPIEYKDMTARRVYAVDRSSFVRMQHSEVRAYGLLGEKASSWAEERDNTSPVSEGWVDSEESSRAINSLVNTVLHQISAFPVLAMYGAHRGDLAEQHTEMSMNRLFSGGEPVDRWVPFVRCLSGKIFVDLIVDWFLREVIERGNKSGQWSSAYLAVEAAVLACTEGATEISFDRDSREIVVTINAQPQLLSHLSAGQRMMFAMVADIAIKCVTQNAYLLNDENPYKAIEETPGVVLIDELDVHLHPKWQRGVAAALKKAFPKIQFVCTSHSPQIIGELHPDEIRILEDGKVFTPPRSFGMDSNRILEIIQDAEPRNKGVKDELAVLFSAVESNDFDQARKILASLEAELGEDDPELSAAKSTMAFIESE